MVNYVNADLDPLTSPWIKSPGFSYKASVSIQDDAPNLQSFNLYIKAQKGQPLQVTRLKVDIRWLHGTHTQSQIPFDSLWVDDGEADDSYFSYHATSSEAPGFDLEALGETVPQRWRQIPAGESLNYQLWFSKPDCRCIPKSIDQILLVFTFSTNAGGTTQEVTRSIKLTPRRRTFSEFYNFKSGQWTHRCDRD